MFTITSFSVIDTTDGKRISYTIKELSDTGEILKSNIRKSFPVLNTDTEILNNIEAINKFILSRNV